MPLTTLLRPAFVALAALALTASVSSAQSSLFTPLGGARLSLSPYQTQLLDALQAERGVEAVDLVAADAALLDGTGTLSLSLPGAEVVLRPLSVIPRPTGHVSWVGRAEGASPDAAWAVLVSRGGQITGEVHVGSLVYPVRPLTGGLHAVARKSMADYQTHPDDYEAFVEAQVSRIEAQRRADAPSVAARRVGGPAATVIDILVPYTADVAAAVADPVALALSFVDTANLTYTNSNVDLELNLLYAYETAYTASGNLSTDLARVTNTSDGNMDEVHGLRNSYGADLVGLISGTNVSGTCGIAYVNSGATTAFSASSAGCGGITFAHEVGHNMGSTHDARTGGSAAYSYGRGYVNDAGLWGTVMAYDSACMGDPCQIVPYLSDPANSYTDTTAPVGSGPTGTLTAAGTADSTNNARVHRERMATVAAFRATKAAPTGSIGAGALALTVPLGGSVSGTVTLGNTAGGSSSPLSWVADLDNLDDAGGTPVASACTGRESVSQTAINFYETHTSGASEIGQSFTAPCSGTLTRVSPAFYGATAGSWEGTLRIYQGAGTGGTELATTALSETNLSTGALAFVDLDLTTPVEVVAGQVYTWFIDLSSGTTEMLFSNTNPYAGGTRYRTTNGNPASAVAQSGNDASFSLRFAPPEQWVALSVQTGSIDPGASADVTVSFDATGYAAGTYSGDLVVATNDPAAPSVTIPLTMTVSQDAFALTDGFGWRMMALPYDGATVETLADQNLVQGVTGSYPGGAPNLYTYDGTDWTAATALAQSVAPGTGFIWYLYDEAIDPDTGDPDNSVSTELPLVLLGTGAGSEPSGNVTVDLHGVEWDLLGNPFAMALDVSAINTWAGASALAANVGQVWQCAPNAAETAECVGSYTTTTLLGDVVPAWHGVFVETDAAGTLTIPLSARGTTTRRVAPRLLGFELATADGSALDRAAAVVFRDGATDGWDGWDARKLASLGSPSVQLALGGTRDGETVLKAQDSRPFDAASFDLPLYVTSAGAGADLTLTWPRLDGIPDDWGLTLTDLESNEAVDLRTTEAYAFTVTEVAARTSARPGVSARLGGDAPRFTLTVQTANAVATEAGAPAETWLGASYPNPARATATVPFGLAEAGPVRLTLVDLLGREVAVLAEGDFAVGDAQAAIPADRLAPGLYVVRLEAGDQVLTRRAVVVR